MYFLLPESVCVPVMQASSCTVMEKVENFLIPWLFFSFTLSPKQSQLSLPEPGFCWRSLPIKIEFFFFHSCSFEGIVKSLRFSS